MYVNLLYQLLDSPWGALYRDHGQSKPLVSLRLRHSWHSTLNAMGWTVQYSLLRHLHKEVTITVEYNT